MLCRSAQVECLLLVACILLDFLPPRGYSPNPARPAGSVHQTVPALQMNIIVDSVCETQVMILACPSRVLTRTRPNNLTLTLTPPQYCPGQGRSWCHGTMHSSPRFESSVPEEPRATLPEPILVRVGLRLRLGLGVPHLNPAPHLHPGTPLDPI